MIIGSQVLTDGKTRESKGGQKSSSCSISGEFKILDPLDSIINNFIYKTKNLFKGPITVK